MVWEVWTDRVSCGACDLQCAATCSAQERACSFGLREAKPSARGDPAAGRAVFIVRFEKVCQTRFSSMRIAFPGAYAYPSRGYNRV